MYETLRNWKNASICRIKHQGNRFYSGMHEYTSMNIERTLLTSDIHLTPEQCKQASEERSLTLVDSKQTFEESKKETHHKWKRIVDGDYKNEGKVYEWITKEASESHIKDNTLNVRNKDGRTFNRNDQSTTLWPRRTRMWKYIIRSSCLNVESSWNLYTFSLKKRLCTHAKKWQPLSQS